MAIHASAVAAIPAAVTAGDARQAAAARQRSQAEAAAREVAAAHKAREAQEAIANMEAEVGALDGPLAQERAARLKVHE